MKLRRIEKRENGNYEILDVIERVNDVIDFLNNSFITNDSETITPEDALVCSDIMLDASNALIVNSDVTELNSRLDTSAHKENLLVSDAIKCPKCGESYYRVGPSSMTCVYYAPVFKDGVNINPDRNKHTVQYECCACGNVWSKEYI